MLALRYSNARRRRILSGMWAIDETSRTPRAARSGQRLFHPASCRSAAVLAAVSEQPFRPLSCMAKHLSLELIFSCGNGRRTCFQYRSCSRSLVAGDPGLTGNVFSLDRPVAESLAGRAL